ncbi:hypothetical protein A8C75_01975 [Marinobacterium aestuarii]|uniref:Uncharacterized protein n=1 Tax=Marinobacterium aestuarii TaxID=1821621 RepID=A0A1A9EUD3_9GAMM|nr:hypothetical protein A8C75_01975 [Marinobacterium aestuarii]
MQGYITGLPIEGITLTQQLLQCLGGVLGLQQRAILVPRRALELLLNSSMQINNNAMGLQGGTIGFTNDGTAAGCQHDIVTFAKVVNDRLLTFTEACLPLYIEYPGNIRPRTGLYLPVTVDKLQIQLVRKKTPYGAFSSSHRAYKKDVQIVPNPDY